MDDELSTYLNSISTAGDYNPVQLLKDSGYEKTEVVISSDGRRFIRKTISRDAQIGSVYEQLHQATAQGIVFNHLPAVYECFATESDIVVIMEYLEGITLQDLLLYENDHDLNCIEDWFGGICEAVIELQTSFHPAIIHRDIKPSNIIVNRGTIKLVDFGISRSYKQDAFADTTHFGTREFASPEQYGFKQTDLRSDVYSLGKVFYYLLTGRIPTLEEIEGPYAYKDIPAEYKKIIEKATRVDPKDRYQNAYELYYAFTRASKTYRRARRTPDQHTVVKTVVDAVKRESIPKTIIGVTWNAFITLIWFVVMLVAIVSISQPSPDNTYPAWFYTLQYIGLFVVPLTSLWILLFDKTRLRKNFPSLRNLRLKKLIVPCLLVFGLSWVFTVIIAQFAT